MRGSHHARVSDLDHGSPPLAPEVVPPEEQYRILDAAKAATSRGKLCESLYGVRGGQKYGWVQKVCDAAGLLVRETVNA